MRKLLDAMIGTGAVALVVVATAACETAPSRPLMSPLDPRTGFGYSERQLEPTRYEVSFATPYVRTGLSEERRKSDAERVRALAYDMALWRAAEIAMNAKYPVFTVQDRQGEVIVDRQVDAPEIHRYGLAHPLGGFRFTQSMGPSLRSVWLQGKATLTILLKRKAEGADDLDAQATAERLASKHQNARSLPVY